MNFRLIISIILFQSALFTSAQDNFKALSVLKSGKWFKIKVEESGIYKLTYDDLRNIGFSNPENIRIYGNNGRQLSYAVSDDMQDDLEELPLFKPSGSESYLFYAEGPTFWNYIDDEEIFMQNLNDFATENYLFLTSDLGAGKRIEEKDYSSLTANSTVNSYSWRGYYEEDLINLIQSGREWFGYQYKNTPFEHTFHMPGIVTGSNIHIKVRSAIRAEYGDKVIYSLNSVKLDTVSFGSVDMSSEEKTHALAKENIYSVKAVSETNSFTAQTVNYGINNKAYIDYVTLNARCQLKYTANPFYFRDIESFLAGGVALFRLDNAHSGLSIWDITDQDSVYAIKGILNGSTLEFKAPVNKMHEYVILDPKATSYPTPVLSDDKRNDLGWIDNQNLHGMAVPELLIVTHPLFKEASDSLARLHQTYDSMRVEVVTTNQVYNEFSSGKSDAAAIRNLSRMLWERSSQGSGIKYLLLVGDGSFDNRTHNEINTNYIPTFQEKESLVPISSYSTDDFYVMLEPGEWSSKGSLELGIGRLPVYWSEDNEDKSAWDMVKKINTYYTESVKRDWRNKMIFLADDMDDSWEYLFFEHTENLTDIIRDNAPEINFTKIYLDAYTQINSSTGPSYPEVETALHEAFNKGALLFNYMGHGGENGITQEKVMQTSDFENLANAPNFPIFFTATCQISRYDYIKIEGENFTRSITAGETALLNPKGGAIAMLTTTRVVYQVENYDLSRSFYKNMFARDENGEKLKLGDLFRIAKNIEKSENDRKFALLGDPALFIPYGEYRVLTDSINHISTEHGIDTVSAFGKVTISGHLEYNDSTLIDDFNGIVQVSVYDKQYTITTKANDPQSRIDTFSIQDKLLFHGNASVKNGLFKVEFIVPKDISYTFGEGKISYYAYNSKMDAKGCFEDFIIGGTDEQATDDIYGPEIELYINSEDFVNGGITGPDPVLLANLFDVNGINTTGVGIGHDVAAYMDGNYSDIIALNDYFEGAVDDYQRGQIRYALQDLDPGQHSIHVKVWDTYNNSTQAEIEFVVKQGDKLIMEKLFNYPNPMRSGTTFQYAHNMPGLHDVILEIFDLSGKKIYSYNVSNQETGFISQPITWNVNSTSTVVQPGVYVYRLLIKVLSDEDGNEYETFQTNKLIIIP